MRYLRADTGGMAVLSSRPDHARLAASVTSTALLLLKAAVSGAQSNVADLRAGEVSGAVVFSPRKMIGFAFVRFDLAGESPLLHRNVQFFVIRPFGLMKFDADSKLSHKILSLVVIGFCLFADDHRVGIRNSFGVQSKNALKRFEHCVARLTGIAKRKNFLPGLFL